MPDTDVTEELDGTIHVSEKPTVSEREKESLERLVQDIRNDSSASESEKKMASAIIALSESLTE